MFLQSIKKIVYLCSLAFVSCQSSEQVQMTSVSYFDMAKFLDKEIELLRNNKYKIFKINSLNKNKDQKEFSSSAFDWEKELALFYDANINKTSFLGKYAVDSLFTENKKLTQLRYAAHSPKTRPQQLDVYFSENQIVSIEIKNHTKNNIYTSTASLRYLPKNGYIIRNTQQLTFGVLDSLQTEVIFSK